MPGLPFLKSNRVEDIRLVLEEVFYRLEQSSSTAKVEGQPVSTTPKETFVLSGSSGGKGEKGDRGEKGDTGADGAAGADGATGSMAEPCWARSEACVPVLTRTGDLVSSRIGGLVTTRAMDAILVVDQTGSIVTE